MKKLQSLARMVVVAAAVASLAACGGGGGSGSSSPIPGGGQPGGGSGGSAGSLALTPQSLSITSLAAQSVTASDSAYTGSFTVDATNCNNIVSVSPSSANGPSANFTLTPLGGGTCTLNISESNGHKAALAVTVTFTQGIIQ